MSLGRDNNFALWKEMIQDVLVQRCQIEDIRHAKVPTGKTLEEWSVECGQYWPLSHLDAQLGHICNLGE